MGDYSQAFTWTQKEKDIKRIKTNIRTKPGLWKSKTRFKTLIRVSKNS